MNITPFSFSAHYVFENETLMMRPLVKEDVQHLSVFSVSEPELWQYSLQSAAGIGNLVQYINSAIEGKEAGHSYPFIIFCKKTHCYAGCTRLYEIDSVNATCYLGYSWIGKEFQGTGVNRNSKWLMLQFAFDQCGFHRVAFRADANNTKSIRAMEAIGCVPEGLLREHMVLSDGSRRSSRLFSLLRSDWEKEIREKLHAML